MNLENKQLVVSPIMEAPLNFSFKLQTYHDKVTSTKQSRIPLI